MRRRAELEDEGRYTVLILSAAVAIAILLTIVFELHGLKDLHSDLVGLHVTLAAGTILLSWFFMNTMFALHYAHGYYGDADPSSEYRPTAGSRLSWPLWYPIIGTFCIFRLSLA